MCGSQRWQWCHQCVCVCDWVAGWVGVQHSADALGQVLGGQIRWVFVPNQVIGWPYLAKGRLACRQGGSTNRTAAPNKHKFC